MEDPLPLAYDPKLIKKRLESFNSRQRLAFLLYCCERMFRNYVYFSQKEKWGNPEIFQRALGIGWRVLEGDMALAGLRDLKATCEKWTPDTNEFGSIHSSSALDAAVSISNMLEYLQNPDIALIMEVVSLSRDSVDMFVQELEDMDPKDPELEKNIQLHPLMQKELNDLSSYIDLLSKTDLNHETKSGLLIKNSRNLRKSNLNL